MRRLILLFCFALLPLNAPVFATGLFSGHFALQGQLPRTEAHLRLLTVGSNPLEQHIDIWMTGPSSEPIRNYSVDMTKRLHVIVISSDFSVFLHIHPELGSDGHFTIDQHFPRAGLYHIYADGEPGKFGQQVFRFDITVGEATRSAAPVLTPSASTVTVGPYTIQLDQNSLHAGSTNMIAIHILQNGKPADDLHPYLGAAAHAVFINSADLSYVHAHPMATNAPMEGMDMDGPGQPDNAASSPDMMLHVSIQEPGIYKFWLQFRGGDQLYVAPFVLTVQ